MKKRLPPFQLSKETLLNVFSQGKRPIGLIEIEKDLRIDRKRRNALRAALNGMLREGSIVKLKNKRYGLPDRMNLQSGTLFCTRSGNGFLVPDKKGEAGTEDVFIPSSLMKGAFHGDRVVARIEHTSKGKREGTVIKVTERRIKNITGFVKKDRKMLYVMPDDERFHHNFVVSDQAIGDTVDDDDLVAARITRFPEEGKNPLCKIVKIFKELKDVSGISQFIKYKYGLPLKFKRSAEAEAKAFQGQIPGPHRADLRNLRHVTIDGESAKDFDDAVCVEKTREGYTLYVSIADVSHFVVPGSSLDAEAFERGTSVYFPRIVVPMLPKILSNNMCSLVPREERLCATVKLDYSSDGDLVRTSFSQSVIRSVMRLTYDEVESALTRKDLKAMNKLKDILSDLEWMRDLATLLAERRSKRGSLDFDLPEPQVTLDMEGGIESILRGERLFSQRIIEEFMIAANEAVAQFLSKKRIPALYRVHESPEAEKLDDFERLLRALPGKYSLKAKNSPGLQAILNDARGSDAEYVVNKVLLRSMKQARYSASNRGHFGLASDCYLHFTSPIRRYPDLVCHRALKSALNGGHGYETKELERMATHLSERERLAMEAEREAEDRIKILFMKGKLGEVFNGVISHITSYGLFVELSDFFVEGLVLLSGLYDDYYLFQEDKFRLIGRRTKKIYRVGDKVRIKVVLANVERNQLHFKLL